MNRKLLSNVIQVRATQSISEDLENNLIRIYTDTNGAIVACLLPNACISNLGGMNHVLHLPSNLEILEQLIRSCTRSNLNISYYGQDTKDLDMIQTDVDILGLPYIDPAYKHFAHFGPKVVAFSLLPASLFLASNRSILPNCASSNGELKSCINALEWPANPRLVVDDRVLNNKKGSWNRDFASFLTTNSKHLHVVRVKNEKNLPTTCFRSAITSPLRYDGTRELHDRLLREKGTERKLGMATGRNCVPHVVILLRDPTRRRDRSLSEKTTVRLPRVLDAYLQRANISAAIEIIKDLGRGREFMEQKAVFARAHILVSAHGAELSNALFLRNGARLVEISPFGLFDGWFRATLFAAGAKKTKICAPPDRERFLSCLKDRMIKRGENRNRVRHSKALKEFDLLARHHHWMERKPKCRVKHTESLKCIRRQRILISAEQLSELIVRETRKFCAAN